MDEEGLYRERVGSDYPSQRWLKQQSKQRIARILNLARATTEAGVSWSMSLSGHITHGHATEVEKAVDAALDKFVEELHVLHAGVQFANITTPGGTRVIDTSTKFEKPRAE